MNKLRSNKFVPLFLCLLLIAASAVMLSGCKQTPANEKEIAADAPIVSMGEGNTEFTFTVVNSDGASTVFKVKTDEQYVGTALVNLGLIEGEDGDYGLYVKTVNGEYHDYDTDGSYWAFYVDGQYATSGVDTTETVSGASYEFRAEK